MVVQGQQHEDGGVVVDVVIFDHRRICSAVDRIRRMRAFVDRVHEFVRCNVRDNKSFVAWLLPESVPERPRPSQSVPDRPRASQIVRESQTIPEHPRPSQSVPDRPRASQTVPEFPEHRRAPQSVPACSRASQSVPGQTVPERPRASARNSQDMPETGLGCPIWVTSIAFWFTVFQSFQ
jgi:hypothetical protein